MKFVVFLFIALIGFVYGQTDKHKVIAGTKCSIIPPAGFVPATSFTGLQSAGTGASIMVVELPVSAQEMSEGFTADALKTQRMTLLDKRTIDFNNAKATLLKVSQQANGTTYLKQILVFGDTKKTIMVNGIYPEASIEMEDEIKRSLLSVSYNENQKNDPLDAARFTVNVTGTDFKLAKSIAGTLLYSTDGLIPTQSPTLTVVNSLAKVQPADTKEFCINRLKQLPRGESNQVKEITPIQVDNMQGYEIIANGKNKDAKDQLVYQAMLFEETGGYFMIIGMSTEDFNTYLDKFKKITRTFKRK